MRKTEAYIYIIIGLVGAALCFVLHNEWAFLPAVLLGLFSVFMIRRTRTNPRWPLVRAFRLLVLGVARNPDAFTGERVSCVSPTRCPRALSAHPTLRPNGLMWGY